MDHHVKEFYCQFSGDTPKGNFHKVIPLHESPHITWESISKLVPKLSKGWYELAHLPVKDRIEFTRDYWLAKMPYHPKFPDFLMRFFDNLDDIAIYVIQRKFDDPYDANMVYSLKGDTGFFRGALPATDDETLALQRSFPDTLLPTDYLSFLQIHDGFCKTTDCTGLIPSSQMADAYREFQEIIQVEGHLTTNHGTDVNPKKVIPFYESFGMPFFQCFWAEWYPEQEMGNVYYSGLTRTISDVVGSSDPSSETMAFSTFTDWLMFYMERIE